MRTMFISENDKYYREDSSEGYAYHSKKEITEAEYKQATEAPYYYQLISNQGDPLDGMYSCCGLINESSKKFYTEYFLHHDSRSSSKEVDHIEKLVIVKGFRGNVAGRDGLEITSLDIIEEYTK